jgi:dTDP-4-dehydrorhamnose reductase
LLVTGASGLLGLNLALEAAASYEVVGLVNSQILLEPGFETVELDLLDSAALVDVLEEIKPDWIIHCAALADLDACEHQPALAQQLNAELPGRLAAEAAKRSLRFLHISTDAIFDGAKGNYVETDAPNPLSVYGKTKRLAELAVKAAHPQWLIVRPNLFGWSANGNRSLAEFFYNNLSAGIPVKGFTDRIFSPLFVGDLARILLSLLEKEAHGIFHAGSSNALSKYDFGVAIANRFGFDPELVRPQETTGNTAARSKNLSLNSSKLAREIGQRLPAVSQGIEHLYEQHVSGFRERLRALAPVTAKG